MKLPAHLEKRRDEQAENYEGFSWNNDSYNAAVFDMIEEVEALLLESNYLVCLGKDLKPSGFTNALRDLEKALQDWQSKFGSGDE